MTAWVVTPAAATSLHAVQSKDEAIAKCNDVPAESKHGHVVVYPADGPKGNDVFYSCIYDTEKRSTFKRSDKCDPATFGEKATPVSDHVYKCNEHGNLVIENCRPVVTQYGAGPFCERVPGYN